MQNADIGGGGGEMQLGLVGGEKGRLDTIRRPLCKRSVSQSTDTLHRIAFEYFLDIIFNSFKSIISNTYNT